MIRTRSDQGVIMPVVAVFLVVLASLGMTVVLSAGLVTRSTIHFSYNRIAHTASKAAIDFAEEEYERNEQYDGTAEQTLATTARYTSTIEIVVLYDQGPSAKRIQAIGRVYIPAGSGGPAEFTREIQASIIRNGEVAGNPADYEPVLWLDAQEPNSLFASAGGGAGMQTITSLYGSANGDVVEERGADSDKNPGQLIFGNDDLEMSWDGSNKGHQHVGLRFRGLNAPQGSTVDDAYIQFTVDQTKFAGAVQLTVEGVDEDDSGQWSGYNDVSSSTKTTANTTWDPPNWNDVGESGEDERVDVTSIVQEIVDRGGWSAGNNISFAISYVQGSGIRTAEKGKNGGNPELVVQWDSATGGGLAQNDGDSVGEWLDKSGNGNDAVLAFGSDGTYELSEINGLDAVRVPNGTIFRSDLSPDMTGDGITAFMVMKPSSSATDSDGRFLTGMNSSQTHDYNTDDGIVPFYRSGSSSTMAQYYDGDQGETLGNAVDDTWSVYTSRISDDYVERLLENGYENYANRISTVDYVINQLYLGGRRNNTSGDDYSAMDVAEVIVYDSALVCSQLQEVENYLGLLYGITIGTKSC